MENVCRPQAVRDFRVPRTRLAHHGRESSALWHQATPKRTTPTKISPIQSGCSRGRSASSSRVIWVPFCPLDDNQGHAGHSQEVRQFTPRKTRQRRVKIPGFCGRNWHQTSGRTPAEHSCCRDRLPTQRAVPILPPVIFVMVKSGGISLLRHARCGYTPA